MKQSHSLILSLFILVMTISSCSDDSGTAVNQPYDDAEIRAKVYTSLYTVLQLDTLGYHVMAVAQGDSLMSRVLWPRTFTRHPEPVRVTLSGMLPLRIVGMDEITPPGDVISNVPYRTMDTNEPVIPAFTMTIERMDATHLVVVCGVFCPLELNGHAACNLTFEHGVWQVETMDFYYLRGGR